MTIEHKIKLGVIFTRRDDIIFPPEECMKNKTPVIERLNELGVSFVDLDDVCPYGMLATLDDSEAAIKKFTEEKIDAIFVCNVAYGAEGPVGLTVKALNLPVLLYGPPDPTGTGAGQKTQLGIYTIGKVLRRMNQPFSVMGSHAIGSERFDRAIKTFIAAANVVKQIKHAKILQVGVRPESFWNVIVDEGALMEQFNIPVYPISLPELFGTYEEIMEKRTDEVEVIAREIADRTVMSASYEIARKSACMKLALRDYAEKTRSTAIAIQCWHSIPRTLGIWPCAAGALLNEEGLIVSCEGDVYGAVSCIIAQAATMGQTPPIFVDYDFEHPTNKNAFNVHHCAMAPISCYKDKPRMVKRPSPPGTEWGGCVAGPFNKEGNVTILRFDGDHGEYSVLVAKGKAVDGPEARNKGSYGWYEVENWPDLENKLATGPYTHHGVVIYEDISAIVYEASKFLPNLKVDFAFEDERKEAERYMYDR